MRKKAEEQKLPPTKLVSLLDIFGGNFDKTRRPTWFEQITEYCNEAGCTVDELIEAHKSQKQPKVKITNLTDNKNTNVSLDTKTN